MNVIDIYPRLRENATIISEKANQPYDGYVVLENDIVLRLCNDGTGYSDNGTQFVCVSRGVGEIDDEGCYDEYEVLGWTETSNCM